ncbi:MAG: Asp-tRNA(Asn)/Glu-tRNA(Gln) amidotransferase subunit GatA [Chloroflexi bacterium]|nr:Asp-tRNA(Asn)/Glu-tRNA(Gln) amidotransferase subunit GatA [Chloroflexota bacterium]MDA1174999.1 Asp-tRNA(Asn)/Glu-tRNA(Gln) amidotransferase subunit GatA [Chloroflexota bacterium]
MADQHIHYQSVRQMSDALHANEISAAELADAHFKRIADLDGRVGSYLAVTPDLGHEQAASAQSAIDSGNAGPLTGVPMQLKDNMATRGVTTTCASLMLEHFVPPYDATVTSALANAGAVLLGKGNMDEFAMGSSTETSAYKPTRNPWDLDRVPGGSSGGPAASVAGGLAPYSLGSDTGGSIRQPASFCGIVGLKPTYGLVSRYGLIAFASSLDQIGPLTRTVEDAALVMNAIAGPDVNDSTSISRPAIDYTIGLKDGVKGLRIGVVPEYFGEGIDPEVARLTREAIKQLEELGAEVSEVSLPNSKAALAVYYVLSPSECSANLARYDGVKYGFSTPDAPNMMAALEATRDGGFGIEVKRRIMMGTYALSSGYYDAYYKKAQQVRTLIRREFDAAFEKVDVLITPTTPTTAFKLGEIQDPVVMHANDVCTVPANIAGIPGISIPCGTIDGLPVGLQLLGAHLSEATLLRAAYAYEQATPWHTQHPAN